MNKTRKNQSLGNCDEETRINRRSRTQLTHVKKRRCANRSLRMNERVNERFPTKNAWNIRFGAQHHLSSTDAVFSLFLSPLWKSWNPKNIHVCTSSSGELNRTRTKWYQRKVENVEMCTSFSYRFPQMSIEPHQCLDCVVRISLVYMYLLHALLFTHNSPVRLHAFTYYLGDLLRFDLVSIEWNLPSRQTHTQIRVHWTTDMSNITKKWAKE